MINPTVYEQLEFHLKLFFFLFSLTSSCVSLETDQLHFDDHYFGSLGDGP